MKAFLNREVVSDRVLAALLCGLLGIIPLAVGILGLVTRSGEVDRYPSCLSLITFGALGIFGAFSVWKGWRVGYLVGAILFLIDAVFTVLYGWLDPPLIALASGIMPCFAAIYFFGLWRRSPRAE